MHTSVAVPGTIEILDIREINPLISKCKIKVCYVGDTPNRNKSIITEEVAREIAKSLPGSPIVGYFNETKGDFEEHNEIFKIKNGNIIATTNTRPYGFVDLNAKVWFEQYLDDNTTYRKYLVTEGYIWTGQYPESKRLFSDNNGNPQSLEFDEINDTFDGFWTKDYNGKRQFFIINEAVISKLCILGEDVEPCFEGASVSNYALQEDFKQTLFNLVNKMKDILEGGTTMSEEIKDTQQVEEVVEETVVEEVVETVVEEETTPEAVVEEPAADSAPTDFKKKEEEEEEKTEEPENKEETEEDEDKKKKYNLDEVTEYVELKASYEDLSAKFSALEEEVTSLREYKATAEKAEKEALIKSFSMLSDEDKQDVVENIDKYSYMDIKSKLSVICVDKKVSFSIETEQKEAPVTYTLAGEAINGSTMPAWLQQVEKYNK